MSIMELAERIVEKVGSDSDIKLIPYEEAFEEGFEDMRHRVPDTTKLRETVNFQQQHDLDGILDRIIQYFRSNEGFE